MTVDTRPYRASIPARLASLGFAIYPGGLADDAELPRDAAGRVAPYIVPLFGQPIPSYSGRGMALGEENQPHVFPFTLEHYAGDPDTVGDMTADSSLLMRGWEPGVGATEIKSSGGYSYTRKATETTPTRFVEVTFWTTIIGLEVDVA